MQPWNDLLLPARGQAMLRAPRRRQAAQQPLQPRRPQAERGAALVQAVAYEVQVKLSPVLRGQ